MLCLFSINGISLKTSLFHYGIYVNFNLFWLIFAVGGIYTVIKTKAGVTVEELGEQYCLIGPYNEACVRTEVEIMEPYNEAMRAAIAQMRDHGIKVRREITHSLFTDRQWNGEGNVFSRVCLSGILSRGSLYRALAPVCTGLWPYTLCSELRPCPADLPDIFKLV